MLINIITVEELQEFKQELLVEFKLILSQRQAQQRWLKSHQVRRILKISPGTLQQLRINGILPFTKLGGVIFYDADDIERVMLERKRNAESSEEESNLKD